MGARGKKRDGVRRLRKSTPEERREAVAAWQKSGLSQAMFSKQWGVSPITFSCWVVKAGARSPGERRGSKPRLAEPVKQEVVAVKRRFPTFGLLKIKDFVRRFSGMSVSTGSVAKVLRAEGLPPAAVVRRRRRKKHVGPPQEFERATPNDLWQTDITYVDAPWSRKPLYLVAFMDDRSRYVVSYGLHPHQKAEIVLEALAEGISKYGKPKEVLTDQGRQYYAWRGKCDFQKRLKSDGIQHVVARAHHPQTVGKCERFWKTMQDELWHRVMLRDLEDARLRLKRFVEHYNFQRPHQSLEGMTPADRFFGVEAAVKQEMERAVEKNALRLALGDAPRKPVYLVGQIDGQSVCVHGEGGKVVVQLPGGERHEIETRDLGINPQPKKETSDERDERPDGDERDDGDGDGEGAGSAAGPGGPQGAPPAPGAQAAPVRGAQEDAAAGEGAVAGGERGGEVGRAQDGDGDPVDVAGQDDA
jgi:transposase InsO family protein/transposase-like protein